MELDNEIKLFFDTMRLIIISNNQSSEHNTILYNRELWLLSLNKKYLKYFMILLQHNYHNFVNLINKIDKKINIIDEFIQFLLLLNQNNNILNDLFYDLWFIK